MNLAERNEVVLANLPLIGFLVSDLCQKADHLSRDDLASAGAIGLIKAAESYDADYGVPFGAYARRRILGALADEMRDQDWASRKTRKRIKDVKRVQETLQGALGRQPSVEEIAHAMGIDVAKAQAAVHDAGRSVESLEESTYERIVFDGPGPEEEVLAAEQVHMVRQAVATLPERMRYIVEQVYFHDRPVKELAEELGLTYSAVSHARIKAIALLRDGLETHYVERPAGEPIPVHSTWSEVRRREYVRALGRRTAGGITRMAPEPVVAKAS